MSGPYTTLNARVKQKIATDAFWLSIDDELGVIFEGEQAFVYSDAGVAVNFKIGDGTKKYSELPFFIAYYSGVTSQKVLSWINITADQTISATFRLNSLLTDIIVYNNSGSNIPLNVGTSSGGGEIAVVSVPPGAVSVGNKYPFNDAETVYLTGITGLECSIFLLYIQLDEAPAIPPTSGGTFLYKRGTVGIYDESCGIAASAIFDFTTGLGKSGSGYDNCVLCGTNGTKARGGKYSVGIQTGQTGGAPAGNASSKVSLDLTNIPAHAHLMFNSDIQPNGDNPLNNTGYVRFERNAGFNRDYLMASSTTTPTRGSTSTIGQAIPAPINVQPDSIIDYYFIAVS